MPANKSSQETGTTKFRLPNGKVQSSGGTTHPQWKNKEKKNDTH